MKTTLFLLFFCIGIFGIGQLPKSLDSLMSYEKTLKDSPERISVLVQIGVQQSRKSPELAKSYFFKAIRMGERIKLENETVVAYSQMALLYNNTGKVDSANFFLKEAEQRSQISNDNKIWSNYYMVAEIINRKRGNISQALIYGQKYLQYSKLIGKKSSIAGAYLNLGNSHHALQHIRPAIESYYNALRIFEEINNDAGKAFCYNNLGNIYKDIGQYQESLRYANLGLELKQSEGDDKGIANSYLLIAENHMNLKHIPEALKFVDKSIKLNKKLGLSYELTRNYWLKGRIYNKIKDSVNAKKFLDFALEEGKDLEAQDLIKNIKEERGNFEKTPELSLGETLKSTLILQDARKANDTTKMLESLENLSNYYYKIGEYKKAFDFREEYQQLRRLVYSPDILKSLKELEGKFELQKKETAIKLLEKEKQLKEKKIQNQRFGIYASSGLVFALLLIGYLLISRNKIVQEQKRLQALETMRKDIAKDLHDDLGSTLSSIQIISNIAYQQTGDQPKLNKTVGHIAELTNKVASGMKEIVWSVNPEHDKLEFVVEQMRKITAEMLEGKNCRFSFVEQVLEPHREISPSVRKDLFLILKESLNNALKYSGTTFIDVLISQNKGNITLEVKDFGKGFDLNTVKMGNGLFNIQNRAEHLNAKWEIKSSPGKGTLISVETPLL